MTSISKATFIPLIRTAIDDIVPSNVTDTFKEDTDSELWQAAQHAATELSMELPLNLLDETREAKTGTSDENRGSASCQLPDTFLRFVRLDGTGFAGPLSELMEPGSDAEKMQRSTWSRGTVTKPKATIGYLNGKKTLTWWPGSVTSVQLDYIKVPVMANDTITCAIRDEALRFVIYRAASIFFEGKKEETIAEKYRNLSTNY